MEVRTILSMYFDLPSSRTCCERYTRHVPQDTGNNHAVVTCCYLGNDNLYTKKFALLLDSSIYFQDFQALLMKFQDLQGQDFFPDSRTSQDFQDPCKPWI